MYMDCNQSLELCPLDLCEVRGRLVDERVQQLQEGLVCLLHHFPIVPSVCQGLSRVACPDHLDSQNTNLGKYGISIKKV